MQYSHLSACFELSHIAGEGPQIGGVQLKQLELVALAQQALDDERRAGIDLQRLALVEGGHHLHITLERRFKRRNRGCKQASDAVCGLAAGACVVPVQPVQTRAGMRVQHCQCRVFFDKVLQGGNQHRVFEHIGVVACVECVAITKHGPMVTIAPAWRFPCRGTMGPCLPFYASVDGTRVMFLADKNRFVSIAAAGMLHDGACSGVGARLPFLNCP